jgi:hypothetical protein
MKIAMQPRQINIAVWLLILISSLAIFPTRSVFAHHGEPFKLIDYTGKIPEPIEPLENPPVSNRSVLNQYSIYIGACDASLYSKSLNFRMAQNGQRIFENRSWTLDFGLQATFFKNRLITGLDFIFDSMAGKDSGSTPNSSFTLSQNNNYISFDLGYVIYMDQGIRMYPLFGIAGSNSTTLKFDKTGQDSFAGFMNNPQRQGRYIHRQFLMHLAFCFDLMGDGSGPYENNSIGPYIGARVGCFFAPSGKNYDWWAKADGVDEKFYLGKGPEAGFQSVYFKLLFGIWGGHRAK